MMSAQKQHSGQQHRGGARHGQVWSLDYTIGFLLFLFSLLLALSVLGKTVLRHDSFSELVDTADAASERLLSTGYPVGWRNDTILIPGLLTDDKLSMRKTERLLALPAERSKALLDVKDGWALTLTEKNGTLLPVSDACHIGSTVTETKSLWTRNRTLSAWPAGRLAQNLSGENLSLTLPANLSSFLANLSDVEVAVMESPRLGQQARPYDSEKGKALEEFVRLGGTLLLIGDLNLTEAFDLNLTLLNASDDAVALPGEETFLNLSGTIANVSVGDWAITDHGQDGYASLARLSDGREYAATFRYGDGDVYYLGGLNGTMNGETLFAHILRSLTAAARAPTATCTSVTLPDAADRVVVRRMAAYKGRIVTLTIALWED